MALEITDKNLKEVLESNKVVVIDFWAEWCGPCKMLGPIIDEVAKEVKEKAIVCKANVDENSQASLDYGIRNVPTVLFIKDGEVVDRTVGVITKQVLLEKIENLVSN